MRPTAPAGVLRYRPKLPNGAVDSGSSRPIVAFWQVKNCLDLVPPQRKMAGVFAQRRAASLLATVPNDSYARAMIDRTAFTLRRMIAFKPWTHRPNEPLHV